MADENIKHPVHSAGHHPVKKVKKKRPVENSSGMGERAVIPAEIKKFNWGAFLFTWIWGIFNKSYLTLLVFLPFVNIVIPFVSGFKGNEWAWRNKHWKSISYFNEVQKKWAIAGVIVLVVSILFAILSFGSMIAMLTSGMMQQTDMTSY